MFGRIFGDEDSKEILKDFLQAILPDLNITEIMVAKQFLIDKIAPLKKFSRLDIVATIDKSTKVNIEMQMSDNKNTISRSLYYAERLGSSDLTEGMSYNDIPKAISIWILNYNLFEDGPYHDISRLRRDCNYEILTNKLEIHYIQLPKFKETHKEISTKLEQWLTFILNEDIEELKVMDNEHIEKAQEKLELLNADEQARAYAEYVADAERNERDALTWAKSEGKAEGLAEGRAEGRAEGETSKAIEIAKNLLSQNVAIDIIIKATGLTEDEVKKLQ